MRSKEVEQNITSEMGLRLNPGLNQLIVKVCKLYCTYFFFTFRQFFINQLTTPASEDFEDF